MTVIMTVIMTVAETNRPNVGSCWRACSAVACACTRVCSAAGNATSRNCRSFASAWATLACACASAARSSLSCSSMRTSLRRTLWPSCTGMRATCSVITAPTERRCGVMMRPLATTVWTRSPRTASKASTGFPRITLRKAKTSTPRTPSASKERHSQRRYRRI